MHCTSCGHPGAWIGIHIHCINPKCAHYDEKHAEKTITELANKFRERRAGPTASDGFDDWYDTQETRRDTASCDDPSWEFTFDDKTKPYLVGR